MNSEMINSQQTNQTSSANQFAESQRVLEELRLDLAQMRPGAILFEIQPKLPASAVAAACAAPPPSCAPFKPVTFYGIEKCEKEKGR